MGCSSSTAVKEGNIKKAYKTDEDGNVENHHGDDSTAANENHKTSTVIGDGLKPSADVTSRSEPEGESRKNSVPAETRSESDCNSQHPELVVTSAVPTSVSEHSSTHPESSGVSGEGAASQSSMEDPFKENDDDGNEADVDEIEDKFDTVSILSSRDRIGSSTMLGKERATQKTMDFVYRKTSTTQMKIDENHDDFGGSGSDLPTFQKSKGFTNRRPSGVPPPVRAAKDGDVMTKFATGKLSFGAGFQELGEEEEEEEP